MQFEDVLDNFVALSFDVPVVLAQLLYTLVWASSSEIIKSLYSKYILMVNHIQKIGPEITVMSEMTDLFLYHWFDF